MTAQSNATLKTYFETGDYPTQAQFGDLIDSVGLIYPYSNPLVYTFQWNNQGTATRVDSGDHVTIIGTATGGTTTYGMQAIETSLSGSGDFTVIGAVRGVGTTAPTTNIDIGVFIRNDSIVYAIYNTIATAIRVDLRTSTSATTNTSLVSMPQVVLPSLLWLKISRTSGTLNFYYSIDGAAWVLLHTLADASTFTMAGFFSENRNSTSLLSIAELDYFSVSP